MNSEELKRIGIVYLCCDDLDKGAVESILRCSEDHSVKLIVHDDSSSNKCMFEVSIFVEEMRRKYDTEILLMRRSVKNGGKPGALNNVFQKYHDQFDYFFICDSDSYIVDREYLNKSLKHFEDPNVALVQLRNIAINKPGDSLLHGLLSVSIDYYDAWAYFLSRFGWTPYVGHNALLKSNVIKKVGWFSPNEFAEDVDYSVKLRLNGYKILYAREIVCGERHPETYRALRKRTRKWSLGCTQVLRKWSCQIAWSKTLSFDEKITFFLTIGYYPLQTLLLLYLIVLYLFLPFCTRLQTNWITLWVYPVLILFFTFFPSYSYFWHNGKIRQWFLAAPIWGLTYGSQDFAIASGLLEVLFWPSKQRIWESTNSVLVRQSERRFLWILEVLFGISILIIPLLFRPMLLALPATILFSGKFVCIPGLYQFFTAPHARSLVHQPEVKNETVLCNNNTSPP